MSTFTTAAPTTPPPTVIWNIIDANSKVEIMQEYFNLVNTLDPEHPNVPVIIKSQSIIENLASSRFRFISMVGGPNAGERRQVYTDSNNAKYYEQGNSGRKIYLTKWINSKKKEMPPTASASLVAQYNNPNGVTPVNLFDDPPVIYN